MFGPWKDRLEGMSWKIVLVLWKIPSIKAGGEAHVEVVFFTTPALVIDLWSLRSELVFVSAG